MKLNLLAHLRPSVSRMAAVAALALGVSSSAFGVVLNFSGGGGTPLSMTLASPVSYTITQAVGGSSAPAFIFQGTGNPFLNASRPVIGSITFSVNGGAAQTITTANSGIALGAVGFNDTYFFGTLLPFALGDTVLLSAGALTTTANIAGAAPAGGDFQSFISTGSGTNISTFGTTVGNAPDAGSTAALLGLGLLGLLSFTRISRRVA